MDIMRQAELTGLPGGLPIHDRPALKSSNPSLKTANDIQIAGDHYKKHKFETWDVILDWNLGYLDGNAVKYLSRWRSKGGVQDLKKAAHYIQKLIEVEEANGNS